MVKLNHYLKISKFVKNFILPIGSNTLIKKIVFKKKKNFAILCYHRIVEEGYFYNNISPLSGLCVSKKKFYSQVKFLKENFELVSLDQLHDHILNKKNNFVVSLTFDDGYKDNLTNALPILEKLEVPFSIFVVTRFLEGDTFMWWYELWDIINKSEFILFDKKKHNLDSSASKINTFFFLTKILINLDLESQKILLKELRASNYNINYNDLCLDWNDIQFLSSHNLVTIGNHTHSHLRLINLNENDLFNEIAESKNILEKKLKYPIKYIAYPFGGVEDISNANLLFTKKINYKLGLSTQKNNFMEKNLLNLPRYNVDNEISNPALAGKINGFEDFLLNIKNFF